MRVCVIGGGISGLSAGFRLMQSGCEVMVLEADGRAGGKIRSETSDGFLVEHGPNGFLDSRKPVLDLVRDVRLENQLMRANVEASKRYIFTRGALRALPRGPLSLLGTRVLTAAGLLRLLCEPFVKPRTNWDTDETVFDFAARRIGHEAATVLVDSMVTGIYAGDSRKLSLQAAFPRMYELERTYGGLVKALFALMKAKRANAGSAAGPAGVLTSFPEGLETLIHGLVRRLEGRVRTNAAVEAIRPIKGGGWEVFVRPAGPDEPRDTLVCDAVVLAVPAGAMSWLLAPHAPRAAEVLQQIQYNPAAVVAFGYPPGSLPRPLDGFGYLVPAASERKILGTLWDSTLFANRASKGRALLRSIVGGARHPELLDMSDDEIGGAIGGELSIIMGGQMPEPLFRRVIRWREAIPQYTVGHLGRVAAIEAATASLPGLHMASNALYGVSLADCIARADKLPAIVRGDG